MIDFRIQLYFVLLSSLLSTIGSSSVFAQEVIRLEAVQLQESYDSEVPVSGEAIVGIRLGSVEGNVDVDDIRLPSFSGDNVCVRIVTQDGRFSANNMYTKTGSISSTGPLWLTPVSLNYANILSKYKVSAFALNAFIPQDGSYAPDQVVHLPQLLPNAYTDKTLTVLVNAGGRFSDMTVDYVDANFSCENVRDGARIAYDTICKGHIATYTPGIKNVSITLDDGFGEESIHFSLLLP